MLMADTPTCSGRLVQAHFCFDLPLLVCILSSVREAYSVAATIGPWICSIYLFSGELRQSLIRNNHSDSLLSLHT